MWLVTTKKSILQYYLKRRKNSSSVDKNVSHQKVKQFSLHIDKQ